MAMEMLTEIYLMLIRYTEIVVLGDGRDDTLLRIKDSYESLILKDFTALQHRGVYKIATISDALSAQNFFSYIAKLEKKLAPLLADRARIQKEKGEERAEKALVEPKKSRNHQEWLASHEYKSMRQK